MYFKKMFYLGTHVSYKKCMNVVVGAISISRNGESGNEEWGMGNGGRESRFHGISKTRNKNSISRNLENTE